MASPITHLWTRISSVKWEDVWVERLRFAGEQSLVVRKFPASRSIRLDLYTDGVTSRKLKATFGGIVRHFDAAGWQPPASKITDPLRIAGKLRIFRDCNLFRKHRSKGRGLPLLIPSGMAFGTGDHATTASCLRLLVEAIHPLHLSGANWSLLDLGCGSGILSLAAELLGAKKILGVDFDDRCVRISSENAALNKLPRSRFRKADVLHWKPSGSYDIVTANLYSTILSSASRMIARVVKPGGTLIISGILSVEETALLKIFASPGGTPHLRHIQTIKRGKWAAMMMKKP